MSIKGNIMKAAARKAKVSPGELRHIKGRTKLTYLKEATSYVISDLLTNDKTLHDNVENTIVEGDAALNQVHPQLKRWLSKPGSFAMFFDKVIPFIVHGGKVYNLSGGTLAADIKDVMEDYVAYKVAQVRESKGKSTKLNRIRKGMSSVNLGNVATKLAAIRAAN